MTLVWANPQVGHVIADGYERKREKKIKPKIDEKFRVDRRTHFFRACCCCTVIALLLNAYVRFVMSPPSLVRKKKADIIQTNNSLPAYVILKRPIH